MLERDRLQAAGLLGLAPRAGVGNSGCSLIPCVFNNVYQLAIVAPVDCATSIIHLCSLRICGVVSVKNTVLICLWRFPLIVECV